ncbi:GPI transamidase subunit PIG-U [Phycomyces nitens]|nr:GPI transamidase subunit PIG-U [Phycomyces nitens]
MRSLGGWSDWALYGCSIALRLVLFSISSVATTLGQRVELVTPVTSFKRLTEGVHLYESNVPPYDGGLVHQSPLLLALFSFLNDLPSITIPLLYSVLDVVIAHALQKICRAKQARDIGKPKLAIETGPPILPSTVAALYLFNPFTILSCVSKSTILFTNLSIVMSLLWASLGNTVASMFWVAMASYLSFYPVMLVAPLGLLLKSRATTVVSVFMGWSVLLLAVSRLIIGSWEFMRETYGVIILLSDLTPNIGMFWYFFIEIFDQFRSFFMAVFQLHSFIFVTPLCIKLRHSPVFVIIVLCGIMSVFKSYPSVGDAALYLGLVPLHDEVFKYCRYGFLVSNLFLYASVLAPIFWHLWIYAGSGNANFFYAITLVYNLGQILLLIDLVYSALRRAFDVAHPEAIGKQVIRR